MLALLAWVPICDAPRNLRGDPVADTVVRDIGSSGEAGDKGLRTGALGMLFGIVIKLLHRSRVPVLVVPTGTED
jgi:hypothetical protein